MSIEKNQFINPISMLSFNCTPQYSFPNFLGSINIPPIFGYNFIPRFNIQNFGINFTNFNTPPQIDFASSIPATNPSLPSVEDFQKKCSEIIYNQPQFTQNTHTFINTPSIPINYSQTPAITTQHTQPEPKRENPASNTRVSTSTTDYRYLSKTEATRLASTDTNLENLTQGGNRWSISERSFINDIPYAAKGTGQILDRVASIVGQNLVITSALGTKTSPHVKGTSCSHYNSKNPKLDIRGDKALADKLRATGYFSHVLFEGDHIDVQIADSAYQRFETLA